MKYCNYFLITILTTITLQTTIDADTIELVNGDSINGEVVSLDAEILKFNSEILGDMTLPRAKIAVIHFGDRKPAPRPNPINAQPANVQPANVRPANVQPAKIQKTEIDRFIDLLNPKEKKANSSAPDSVDGALKRLRTSGVDGKFMEELQAKMPAFASPEVQDYFNKKVAGLMSGKIGVKDIRKDAINVVDQIKDLKKDLGPDADALNPYLNILENFIRKTEPRKN